MMPHCLSWDKTPADSTFLFPNSWHVRWAYRCPCSPSRNPLGKVLQSGSVVAVLRPLWQTGLWLQQLSGRPAGSDRQGSALSCHPLELVPIVMTIDRCYVSFADWIARLAKSIFK